MWCWTCEWATIDSSRVGEPLLGGSEVGLERSIVGLFGALAVLLLAACGSSEDGSRGGGAEQDVSRAGQVDYACALTAHIIDVHGYPTNDSRDSEHWGNAIGEDASPGFVESAGVAGLLGGMNGADGYAKDVASGITRVQFEQLRDGLEGVNDWCADRE